MAKYLNVLGDLLEPSTYVGTSNGAPIIMAHQVNALGIMGGGLAKQVRSKHPNVFMEYKKLCGARPLTLTQEQIDQNISVSYETDEHKFSRLMGTFQAVQTDVTGQYIVNLFGQKNIGIDARQTDYEALYIALDSLRLSVMSSFNNTGAIIAFPKYLGSDLGGGDWRIIYSMIKAFAADLPHNFLVCIVEYNGEQNAVC